MPSTSSISPRHHVGRPPTRLLVVRHGQSEWNALGRWQGHADIPLDRTGELQAAAAAEVLGQFDAIWSSDLARAHRTAQIVAELLGVGPVRTDARLRERDVGPWEGLTHQEVERNWPGYLQSRRRPDGFEDEAPAALRMLAAFADIAAEHPGGEVLVVSHGGVIRAARRHIGPEAPHLPNLSGAWFEVVHRPDHDPGLDSGRDSGRAAVRVVAGEVVHLLVEEQDVAEAL